MINITVRGREFPLDEKEKEVARLSLKKFFDAVREAGDRANSPTYYYTLLITAQVMINDEFDMMDIDLLQGVFEAARKAKEQVKG